MASTGPGNILHDGLSLEFGICRGLREGLQWNRLRIVVSRPAASYDGRRLSRSRLLPQARLYPLRQRRRVGQQDDGIRVRRLGRCTYRKVSWPDGRLPVADREIKKL